MPLLGGKKMGVVRRILRSTVMRAVVRTQVDLRRASLAELRSALLRAKKLLPPANTSGLEGVLGRCCEVPSDGTSLLLAPAQMCGSGARAEQEALE